MHLKHLRIERFRGIRSLEWTCRGRVVCLVGPGDSTKTTILDAIELTLAPRRLVLFTDADFLNLEIDQPIVIEATVGDLPDAVKVEDRFGLELRGWSDADGLVDEPVDGTEPVLTIRLTVDGSLEPVWTVVNNRNAGDRRISAKDRETLGVFRLASEVGRHLAWARGSALARNTEGLEEVGRVLADAHREARVRVATATMAKLAAAATRAEHAAGTIGVQPKGHYRPALDAGLGFTEALLSLHDDQIPVSSAGLGTRRLVALALQNLAVPEGAILLVDEVEHALEPHRLLSLLSVLTEKARQGKGQVLMTTHSPVPIGELRAMELGIVRSVAGTTTVQPVGDDLQGLVRRTPEALLARRVIVCEGKTELGILRHLSKQWLGPAGQSFAQTGTVITEPRGGAGSTGPETAIQLAGLGYATCVVSDSDQPISPGVDELSRAGVAVIQWDGGLATEQRVACDLPVDSLQALLDVAVDQKGEESVLAVLNAESPSAAIGTVCVRRWAASGIVDGNVVRSLIGKAAKKGKWYKRVDVGERLGEIIERALPEISGSDLANKLAQVRDWAYAD